jgi:hypothetical protein
MRFAKWFGRAEDNNVEDDEPARFDAPSTVSRPITAAPPVSSRPKTVKGFDPYNSGAFERRNAWERVNRR